MQITINQHYVPRYYLKPFCDVINPNTKKENCFISFYQFKGELIREHVPTTSICSEDYFYDNDGSVEKVLAAKEIEWSTSLKKVIYEEEIEEEDYAYIREFTIYQICRTKAMLMHSQKLSETILVDTLCNGSSDLDREKAHDIVSGKIKEEITPDLILSLADDLVPVIEDLKITILTNKSDIPFLLSDAPVIVTNPFGIDSAGLGSIGTIIFFPVSRTKTILLYDNKMFGEIQEYIDDEMVIDTFNKYQFICADERILTLHVKEFNKYLIDVDLAEKRLACQMSAKANTIKDTTGTFAAAKSRNVSYCFDITLFKLPKQLQKIPINYREAVFSRKYSYNTRRAILCRIYRNPDFIDKPELKEHWLKKQEYSKKLLEYLDYYWKTPKEDRTISPELMDELKAVPVKCFFPES